MIAKIKKIKPLFNMIITTCDKYNSDVRLAGTNLIDSSKSNAVKEYQKVLAVGPTVRGIQEGDTVFINPNRYKVVQHKEGSLEDGVIKDNPVIGYRFETVNIDGQECLVLFDNDIKFVAEIEEFEEQPILITEANTKILS